MGSLTSEWATGWWSYFHWGWQPTTTSLSTPTSTIILLTLNFKWVSSAMPLPLHGSLISVTPLAFTFTCPCHDLEVSSFETLNFNNSPSNHNLISFQLLLHHPSILVSLIKLNLLVFFPISHRFVTFTLILTLLRLYDLWCSTIKSTVIYGVELSSWQYPQLPYSLSISTLMAIFQPRNLQFLFSAPIPRELSTTEEASTHHGTMSR